MSRKDAALVAELEQMRVPPGVITFLLKETSRVERIQGPAARRGDVKAMAWCERQHRRLVATLSLALQHQERA